MFSPSRKLHAVLLSAAGLVLVPSALHAQVRVMPSLGNQPSMSTKIGAANANWSQLTQGGNRSVGFNSGWGRGYGGGRGWGGWGGGYGNNNYFENPAGAYLSGASQVISSQAEFMKAQQQTNLMREQVKQAQIDTHRKTFDEWKYEQANQPTAEEQRLRREQAAIDRARGNPPSTEIWSGDALNTLLTNIQKLQGQFGPGPTIMLDPDMLRRISVTDGTSFGQGMLSMPKMEWPYSIEGFDFFDSGRKRMEKAMGTAMQQLMSGKRVEARVITEMLSTVDDMRATLRTHIHDLTPSQGVEARRFMNDLGDTARTMQSGNAVNFASGKWAARGNTVTELVDNLTRDGLRFGPVASGNESAYTALYQAMLNYDRALASVGSTASTAKQ